MLSAGCTDAVAECYTPPDEPCTGEGQRDDGGPPASCIPSQNSTPVADSCGVFVSSSMGDDTNSGTESAPLKTLAAAVKKAGAGSVYACGEIFTEPLTPASGTTLYGALDSGPRAGTSRRTPRAR